jgi:hypothetical protein
LAFRAVSLGLSITGIWLHTVIERAIQSLKDRLNASTMQPTTHQKIAKPILTTKPTKKKIQNIRGVIKMS